MQFALASITFVGLIASPVMGITIEHTGLPVAGPGGSTGCIPTCTVYVRGERGCEGAIDFTGACNERTGDTTRALSGGSNCDGKDVRWIVTGDSGSGTIQVRDASGWDEFRVDPCEPPKTTSIRCTYDGGCAATKVN